MAVRYNTSIVSDGLVGYIDCVNPKCSPKTGTSPIALTDLSGGAVWYTQNGCTIGSNYITTDGNAGYIISNDTSYKNAWSPNSVTGNPSLTIEVVFSSSDTGGDIVSRQWSGSGEYNYQMGAGSFSLYAGGSSSSFGYTSICDGNIKHMVWWMNQSQFGVYKNGVEYVGATNHGITGGGGTAGSSGGGIILGTLYPYGQGWGGNTGFLSLIHI